MIDLEKLKKQTQEALKNETNESLAKYLSEIQPSQMSTPLAIEKEFAPYQEALELKELGFDEECFGYYDLDGLQISKHHWYHQNKNSSFPLPHTTNNPKISAPTFSQAFRFFREKYDLCGYTITASNYIKGESKYKTRFSYEIYGMNEKSSSTVFIPIKDLINVSTHEEAELACLKKLIQIVRNENK